MKPEADQGVVDARLNVYGVTGLKVADLSIVPKNVGTVSTASDLRVVDVELTTLPEHIFDGAPRWREGCDAHC
jgi:alcohol oxidase